MANPKYDWSRGLPELDNHSKCKHEIIHDYLVRYMLVVTKGLLPFTGKTFNLTIVDGFAGGGLYRHNGAEVDGSPLVLLKAVEKASKLIAAERKEHGRDKLNINVDFFFVEKEKAAVDYLQNALRSNRCNTAHVCHGEFAEHLPKIIQFIKNKSGGKPGRAIFVLDQFGFSEVLLTQMEQIMNSLAAEIILTFAVDSLVAYLGDNRKPTLKKIGFTDTDVAKIFNRENPDQCRRIIQHVLSRHILNMGKFFTPFYICSDRSSWGYWLVHVSKHYRARDEMMDLHWKRANDLLHHGGEGIDMLGYRSGWDEQYTRQKILGDEFRFDAVAKKRVLTALRAEIPQIIHAKEVIKYSDFLNMVFNHTPASREIMNEALWEGVESKEFSIPRRAAKNIDDSDIIKLAPQRIIIFNQRRK